MRLTNSAYANNANQFTYHFSMMFCKGAQCIFIKPSSRLLSFSLWSEMQESVVCERWTTLQMIERYNIHCDSSAENDYWNPVGLYLGLHWLYDAGPRVRACVEVLKHMSVDTLTRLHRDYTRLRMLENQYPLNSINRRSETKSLTMHINRKRNLIKLGKQSKLVTILITTQ